MHRCRWRVGIRTAASPSSRAAISVIASASRRKSSSSRSPLANWASSSPDRTPLAERRPPLGEVGEQGEGGEVAFHRRLDPRALDLHDDGLAGAQPGPMGLPDRRCRQRLPVELGEHGVDVVAQLGAEHAGDRLARLGRHPVLQLRQLGAHVARQQVDACRGDLTELDVDPACLLEDAAQPNTVARRGPVCVARPSPTEALAPGEADQLSVAQEHLDAAADRPQRSRGDDQPGALADRQRAGTSEQVEGDRRGHRRRDPDGHEVHQQTVGTPVPAVHAEGDGDGDAPAQRRRRARPSPSRDACPAAAATRW